MKKALLCPPLYYDIKYQINPWMHITTKVNQEKVRQSYKRLKRLYQKLGVEILEIKQERRVPDMVYAANYGSPHNNIFIKSNFKFNERKKESEFAKKYFEKSGFIIKELPKDIAFEGQGDLLKVGDKYFFGWGKRSDKEAKKYLSKFLDMSVIDLELIDPYYYHLDTCFLPLNKNTVAINPLSFEKEGLEKIKKNFENIIHVSKKDNAILACNALVVGDTIVIGKGISQKLKNDFKTFGFKTQEVEMQEFRKGGGSVKCLTLEFY